MSILFLCSLSLIYCGAARCFEAKMGPYGKLRRRHARKVKRLSSVVEPKPMRVTNLGQFYEFPETADNSDKEKEE